MLNVIRQEAEKRMQKTMIALEENFNKMRTGRAHASLLDQVIVNCYGNDMPLNQLATVSASDARSLAVSPWDKKMIPEIEKAIMKADLGLNPVTTGDIVRVPMPALSEERRKEFVKIVKTEAEQARVSIRNIRRDANQESKDLLKKKEVTEDDERRFEDQIQKLTDKYIADIDKAFEKKEKELMEI